MEGNIHGRSNVGVNGLGPPIEASSTVPSENLQELILQLKKDLEICKAKIKGYETLGHMLHESKLECARYKQTNENLAKKLDTLSKGLPQLGTVDKNPELVCVAPAPNAPVPEWVALDENERRETIDEKKHENLSTAVTLEDVKIIEKKLLSNPVVCSENVTCPPEGGHQPYETTQAAESYVRVAPVNLEELGAKTPPSMSPQRNSPDPSDFSSVSFVRISNSPSSNLSRRSSSVDQIEQGPVSGNDELSSKISHLAKQLDAVSISDSASVEDLAADLIQASVLVTRLQKEAKIQQVLITEMTKQISELKADSSEKLKTIQILQKESDSLRNTVKRMAAREQAIQEVRDESSRDCDFGSAEWVDFEEQQATGKATAGPGIRQTVVTSVPVELRDRIEKLNATVSELVSVNHHWDDHCRQITASHEQQIIAMQTLLNESQLRSDEFERAAKSRQRELDDLLLGVKKLREADEVAREGTQSELNIETSRRVSAEVQCMELKRKNRELEQRLAQLQSPQQAEFIPQSGQTTRFRMEPSSTREEELTTQLFLAQEQVSVFKEDFDKERRDRESAIAEVESLRNVKKDINEKLYTALSQLARVMSDLDSAKKEGDSWRTRFMKLSGEVQAIQRTARPQEDHLVTGTAAISTPPNIQQVSTTRNLLECPSWNCLTCTFNNSGLHYRCEMCGKAKPEEYQQQSSTFTITGGRSVAGLQPWTPEITNALLISRGLGGDVPDKEQ